MHAGVGVEVGANRTAFPRLDGLEVLELVFAFKLHSSVTTVAEWGVFGLTTTAQEDIAVRLDELAAISNAVGVTHFDGTVIEDGDGQLV
jgi:hypothetical protein